jgi:hypothetical protein
MCGLMRRSEHRPKSPPKITRFPCCRHRRRLDASSAGTTRVARGRNGRHYMSSRWATVLNVFGL